jgi:accessory gene regulator protein AgrB
MRKKKILADWMMRRKKKKIVRMMMVLHALKSFIFFEVRNLCFYLGCTIHVMCD